jgi:hypothetical protein
MILMMHGVVHSFTALIDTLQGGPAGAGGAVLNKNGSQFVSVLCHPMFEWLG